MRLSPRLLPLVLPGPDGGGAPGDARSDSHFCAVPLTAAQLRARPALRARVAMPDESWTDALAATGTAVFRHDDADGALVLVVVANTVEQLRGALPAFARGSMAPTGRRPVVVD